MVEEIFGEVMVVDDGDNLGRVGLGVSEEKIGISDV
jgi:hypothetical protein